MAYVEFTIRLLLIVFCGMGIYRLWTQMIRPAWVNWALLPATIVSEMAYIFGCLITGGEVRRARLIDTSRQRDGAEPTTEAAPRLKLIGPVVAALLAILACGVAIGVVHWLLGEPVMAAFQVDGAVELPGGSSAAAAGAWEALWLRLEDHLRLLRRTCETFARLEWTDWRVPLFVYLAACLSVRLAPVRRDLRATLAAATIVAATILLIAAASARFDQIVASVRPILAYVWGNLLLLLVASLLIRGAVGLVRALAGKRAG